MRKYTFMAAVVAVLTTSCQEEVLDATVPTSSSPLPANAESLLLNMNAPIALVNTSTPFSASIVAVSANDVLVPPTNLLSRFSGQVASVQYFGARTSPGFRGGSARGGNAFIARVDEPPFTLEVPTALETVDGLQSVGVDLLDSEGNILESGVAAVLKNGKEIGLESRSIVPIYETAGTVGGAFGQSDGERFGIYQSVSDTLTEGQSTTVEVDAIAGAGLYDISVLVNDPQTAGKILRANLNGQEETLQYTSYQLSERDLGFESRENVLPNFLPFAIATFQARLGAGANTLTLTSLGNAPVPLRRVYATGVLATPITVPFGDIIEAESGELIGGASLFEREEFSGGEGVVLAQPGQRVSFTLNAEQAGQHRFLISARVTASSTNVQADVFVNGEQQNERVLEFFSNSGRTRDVVSLVDLQAGENTVEVRFKGIRGRGIDDLEIDLVSFGFDTGVGRLPIVQ